LIDFPHFSPLSPPTILYFSFTTSTSSVIYKRNNPEEQFSIRLLLVKWTARFKTLAFQEWIWTRRKPVKYIIFIESTHGSLKNIINK